jgi:O-succinylbenzoic acid--CoA ligase
VVVGVNSAREEQWAFEDWIARRANVSPGVEAVVDARSGESWSYAELDSLVDRTAARLAELGVESGDHLGTLLGTRVATVRVVHAAARTGAVLVPLNPELPPGSVATQVDQADVTAIVCSEATEDLALGAAESNGEASASHAVPVASVDEPQDGAVTHLPGVVPGESSRPVRRRLDDPAMVLFTSGTTGDPKPVKLTAGNLLASATASAFRLGVSPTDRWFCELPAYHMGGVAPLVRSALYGTTVVLQRREDGFEARTTLSNLRESGATGVSLVPTQLDRLLDVGPLPDSLRFVLLGGGPAPEELIERCERAGVPVHPTYGTTETTSQIATGRPETAFEDPATVGRPLVFTDVTVVDEDGRPVEDGTVGELVVDGPTVTPGYYDDPETTADAFGRFGLHTGDRGYRDESGRLYVLGRFDDRIVTGGENVDPTAVVDAIRSVEGVEDAAVVGMEDPEWGERVGALVVPAGEGLEESSGNGIRQALRGRLADYELPRRVAFAASLPRTTSGTVDRDAVRAAIRDGDSGGHR